MKKIGILILALAFFAGMTGMVSAAQNVGNTSQKGSLLIFPKIDVSGYRDTIVMISNDYSSGVDLQCYWMSNYQDWEDFSFRITKKQPVWFSAKTGIGNVSVPPFGSFAEVGELKCWAVDSNQANQISWNHLFGTAKVIDFRGAYDRVMVDSLQKSSSDGWAYEYSSWNFTARGVAAGAVIGTPGTLALTGADDGASYDGCPQYLLFNVAAVGAEWGYPDYYGNEEEVAGFSDYKASGTFVFKNKTTDLTIALCKQDLRQDRTPTYTKLKLTAWNGDEVKYTGAYACAKCWYESTLDYLEGGAWGFPGFPGYANGSEKFTVESLHTNFALLRVQGVASAVCNKGVTTVPTGLVGLSTEFNEVYYVPGYDNVREASLQIDGGGFFGRQLVVSGTTANGAGVSTDGYIEWDAEGGVIPELRR